MNMQPRYPIFTVYDEPEVVMIEESAMITYHYEENDLDTGEIHGWDVDGHRIRLSWEKRVGPVVEVIDDNPNLGELREAIIYAADYYARFAREALPDQEIQPFRDNYTAHNVVELHKAAERYTEELPSAYKPMSLWEKIRLILFRRQ